MNDFSELNTLAADLTKAGLTAGVRVLPVVHRAANNIVRDARQFAPKSAVAQHYPDTITYDIEIGAAIAAEIGPDRDLNGQAKLGNLFEYGSVNNAPQAHLGPALDREGPNFETYIAAVAAEGLLR